MPGARSIRKISRSSSNSNQVPPSSASTRKSRQEQDQSSDAEDSSSSTSQGSPSERGDREGMIGCRVAKYHGKNLRFGYVKDYLPPAPGKAEPSWTVRYGEDSDKDEIEELGRLELNKQLNLQKTAGWETSPDLVKKGRGRPSKASSKRSAKGRTAASPKPSGAKKQRSATYNSPAPPRGTGKKKMLDSDAATLSRDGTDKGKRVAKEFPEYGVFTGDVVNVQTDSSGVTLWGVTFEDGDREDYYQDELEKHIELYNYLSESFVAGSGRNVTSEDEAKDSDINDNVTATKSKGQGTVKGKEKGKAKRGGGGSMSVQQMMVGVGVRKFFPSRCKSRNKYYDGKVTQFLPPESDDDYGDLYHVKYEDHDSEDLDSNELEKAKALYDRRYPLVRKEISFSGASKKTAKVVLFGETLAGSPVFRTIKGYRRFQKTS